ncbi:MAG: ABC transporter ATP-binding protein [Bacteroidales bacterium]|nr:ABC transporter ATP-binding protein [Bacteroidales bacterium]
MTAIEFDHVGKQYRLGLVSTQTLSHDLQRWWAMNVRHKEDPYLKIGETNDRTVKGTSDYVWALKDIDFKVEQGDVVGIIGRNGAGKSTLLKLLSKVTGPTTGTIRARGRIGSLLEVGTGFHPEMTGRENIYMNGAILGMTKQEIARKLDEIVDFSGCERYLDTPVKRYSSGMMVRLGFAVAAHLDPEILVVDEVLAVGDAEFQKKAIGKMKDVSQGEGRTVLFVSHNMAAVKNLCKRGIVLDKGKVVCDGTIDSAIDYYLNPLKAIHANKIIDNVKYFNSAVRLEYVSFNNSTDTIVNIPSNQRSINICVEGVTCSPIHADVSLTFRNLDGIVVASFSKGLLSGTSHFISAGHFVIKENIVLPKYLFSGDCLVDVALCDPNVVQYLLIPQGIHVHFDGNCDCFGTAQDIKNNGFVGLEWE